MRIMKGREKHNAEKSGKLGVYLQERIPEIFAKTKYILGNYWKILKTFTENFGRNFKL